MAVNHCNPSLVTYHACAVKFWLLLSMWCKVSSNPALSMAKIGGGCSVLGYFLCLLIKRRILHTILSFQREGTLNDCWPISVSFF